MGMALHEYFSHPRLVILLFPNLAHKTKAGTAYGRRLLIATQLDQSNHLANQHFSHPRLVIYFFPILTHKTKTETVHSARLLTATHLDQSNDLGNQ
jgi:hypothetical protein